MDTDETQIRKVDGREGAVGNASSPGFPHLCSICVYLWPKN